MSLIQLPPDIYVPAFVVKVNDKRLDLPHINRILEISVTEHLSPPSQFSFRLNDPKLEFIDPQSGLFAEGTRVEISLGFAGNTRKMMAGEISALTADFPNSGPATIYVEGFDLLHRLTRGTVYRTFGGEEADSGMPDSEIVTQIAGEADLVGSVDKTPAPKQARVQNHKTNLAFLQRLAEENGYFLWIDGKTLYFKREQPALDTIKLKWGKTLMSFSPRLSTAGQVDEIEVRGWDPIQRQAVSSRAKRGGAADNALAPAGRLQIGKGSGGKSERVIEDAHVTSAQEAQALAEKLVFDQNRVLITGSGSSPGPPDIRPGTILDLSGIGRFNGEYVVEQVTHSIGGGGYQTSFEVKRRL